MQTIIEKHPITAASKGSSVEFSFSPLLGIAIAAVLGGAVGIQRQAAAKPAGFRTHLLVATASAGFTAMGAHLHDTRIPSYVVVGIGFLGAGAIVRHGTTPHGLTTAASIWMSAAIGLALGYATGFGLFVGLLITAITIVALILSDSAIMHMFGIPHKATIRVTCISPRNAAQQVRETLAAARVRIETGDLISVTSEGATEIAELIYQIVIRRDGDVSSIVREIGALSSVRKVECSEPFFGA
jgi:putative Mg2+ transporter-C (MgtC) family protein